MAMLLGHEMNHEILSSAIGIDDWVCRFFTARLLAKQIFVGNVQNWAMAFFYRLVRSAMLAGIHKVAHNETNP
jgi:hypothetical protein